MTFEPRFRTLLDLLDQSLATYGPRPLFGTKRGGTWVWTTYTEFGQQVDKLRAALAALCVGPGDRVAMLADNRVEWAVACYATAGRGAAYVPMYEAQLPKDWAYILRDSGTRVLFVANQGIAVKIASVRSELPELEHVVVLDGAESLTSWAELLAQGAAAPVPPVAVEPDDLAAFIYTSGTTGDPKGVLLSHGNLASNVSGALAVFPIQPEHRSLSFLPWAHSFGQTAELHTFVGAGASMGLAESVKKIVDNMGEVQPSILIAVPRIFHRIYDGLHKRMAEAGGVQLWVFEQAVANAKARRALAERGERSLPRDLLHQLYDRVVFAKVRERFGGKLEFAISGGAALSRKVAEFLDDVGIIVFEGYGLTETSPVVAANHPGARRIGTVGPPFPGVRVVLDHEVTGDPVDGEIVVYGPGVMQGYHGLPEVTAEVFTADGGFRTGDMGRFDADGNLAITGRIKEQYKLENGKYVVPTPLEDRLKLAPLVANALVYGDGKPYNVALVVPDPEAVAQWARTQGLSADDPEALYDHPDLLKDLDAQLTTAAEDFKHYERPRHFAVVAEDFSTENGMLTPSLKVKRRAVLAAYGDRITALYQR